MTIDTQTERVSRRELISQRLNIKDLVIDEPAPSDCRFDPLEKLTDDDLDRFIDLARHITNPKSIIWKLRAIYPATVEILRSKYAQERKIFEKDLRNNVVFKGINFFEDFKFIAPESFEIPKDFENLQADAAARWTRAKITIRDLDDLASFRHTFPGLELGLDDEMFSKCLAISREVYNDKSSPFKSAVRCFANTRVLYPNRFSEFRPDNSFWRRANEEIEFLKTHEKYVQNGPSKVADLINVAYYLKILFAKDITITESGIELIEGEQVEPQDRGLQLPDVRKF